LTPAKRYEQQRAQENKRGDIFEKPGLRDEERVEKSGDFGQGTAPKPIRDCTEMNRRRYRATRAYAAGGRRRGGGSSSTRFIQGKDY